MPIALLYTNRYSTYKVSKKDIHVCVLLNWFTLPYLLASWFLLSTLSALALSCAEQPLPYTCIRIVQQRSPIVVLTFGLRQSTNPFFFYLNPFLILILIATERNMFSLFRQLKSPRNVLHYIRVPLLKNIIALTSNYPPEGVNFEQGSQNDLCFTDRTRKQDD